ncbi:MAG: hypothetical protein LBC94_01945 [Desulfovibrio sp.]|jgi:hypothetical protein|nr:hypothetical protein [Desulfovibrio sp.]
MTTLQKDILRIRLRNCIQTILELEPELNVLQLRGKYFNSEISMLKNCLHQVDKMILAEDDVQRLETATANFLAELKLSTQDKPQQNRLLQ